MFDINLNRAKRENVDVISFYKSSLTIFFIVIFSLSISLNIVNAYNKIIFFFLMLRF